MKQTRYRRVSKDLVIATERTINEPAKSRIVNAVIKLFFIVSVIGFIYYVKLLRG